MTSVANTLLGVDGAMARSFNGASPFPVNSVPTHLYIDQALTSLSIVLALIILGFWLARGRRDPLALAPRRVNALRPEVIFVAMMVYLVAYLAASLALGIDEDTDPSSPPAWLAAGIAQVAGIVGCLVLGTHGFERRTRGFLLGPAHPSALKSLALLLCFALLALGLCPVVLEGTVWLIRAIDPEVTFPVHSTIESLRLENQPPWMSAFLWIGAALLAPVAEELFFRGILQTIAVNLIKRRWVAIGLSSAAFALVHMSQPHVVPALFVLALMLGFCYERSGSLALPIALHSLFNLKTLIWESLQRAGG